MSAPCPSTFSTLAIIDAVVARLRQKIPTLTVEYFPESPAEYRVNHPRGALLVSYTGSQFEQPRDLTFVAQARTLRLSITVILRQLNGRGGAVDVLDAVRAALAGFTPPDCRRKLWAQSEQFLGETAGLWQYAVDFSTETMLVEAAEGESSNPAPLLFDVRHEEVFNAL